MKKFLSSLFIFCTLALATFSHANAQSASELQLGLSRDFGYGGFGNDIQGLFSMKINNPPESLSRVEFFIDAVSIGEDTQPPFGLQFNTDSYPLGEHELSAIGYTTNGEEINSNIRIVVFVPASAATDMIAKIVGPILGLILIIILISFVIPLLLTKGKKSSMPLGTQRNYGLGGGAICPKCGRPFPLRLWWINLGFHKIDRCPYCGKWSFVRRSSLADLRAAEVAEQAQAQSEKSMTGETDSDKLKKELDDSRFQNL
ncbi:MAG: hypothetical protein A2Y88_04475 [Chloroflexi bacterium RBG_13_48_10]|nr:MAG: hypothetical protein A2Y88_04475 [Chloroflexi bacterium RBG_13_48_10]